MALTESIRAGEFLLAEANGSISREKIDIAANSGDIVAGTLLGKVTATGEYAPYNDTAEDGTEIAAGVLYAGVSDSASVQSAVGIVRHAEVIGSMLTGSGANGIADLAALHILVR